MDVEIRYSVLNKRIIEFIYDGHLRRVEPFCYGVSTAGNPVLRAYQIGGYSKSGAPLGWRMYDLRKATNIRVLDETFSGIRLGYKLNDSDMTTIYCQVS